MNAENLFAKDWKIENFWFKKRKIVPNWPGYYYHLQRREESLTGILRPTSTSMHCNNIAMFYAGWVMLLKLLWLLKHLQCQKKRIITYIHIILFCILTSCFFLSVGWSRSPIQGTGLLQLLPHHIILILIYPHIWSCNLIINLVRVSKSFSRSFSNRLPVLSVVVLFLIITSWLLLQPEHGTCKLWMNI